jgi:hypothetical protein
MTFLKIIRPLEGGLSNDPQDSGGLTKFGVTLGLLKQIAYDTNKDGIVDAKDIYALTYPHVRKVVIKAKIYKPSFDKLQFEDAFHMINWAWASGSWRGKFFVPLFTKSLHTLPDYSRHITLNVIRSHFYRNLIKRRPKDRKFRPGWFAKSIQSSFRAIFGLSLPHYSFYKNFKYEK